MPTTPTNSDKPIQFAVFNGSKEITKEMYKEVQAFANYVKELEKQKNRPDPGR